MTSKDLKDLLGAVADEGRDTVDLDERALAGRIKGRRRRNALVAGAASLGTAAVIAIAAVAVVPNLGGEDTPVAGTRQAAGLTVGGCGGAVSGEARADGPITLEASPAVQPVSGRPDYLTVDVRITNTTDAVLKDLVSLPNPQVSVVQAGKVVATPLPARTKGILVSLQPGETKSVATTIGLRHCSGAATQTGEPLAPGSYQLYATQTFTPTSGGEPIEAQGGPWTVELK